VLYRNAGKILTKFGQLYLPSILVKNPDGGKRICEFQYVIKRIYMGGKYMDQQRKMDSGELKLMQN
jgi:hypothetical protein